MAKRIVIGGLHHESDTFNPIITGRNDIYVYHGEEIYDHLGDKPHVKTIACIAIAPELCLDYQLPTFPSSSPVP